MLTILVGLHVHADSGPACLSHPHTQQIYVNSVTNPSSNCFCEPGSWGNTPDINGCELCKPGTYSDFTPVPEQPNPSVVQITNRPDLTEKCAYYSPTTCAGKKSEGTPQPECNQYGWPYGCKNCPCGKYNKGFGNTQCWYCPGQGPGTSQDSCPGGTSPGRTDCPCADGQVFQEKQSATPTGWKFTTTANPPEYSTAYSEGLPNAYATPIAITAYRNHYGKDWWWAPSRRSNFNMARCSKQAPGYVEFVTTEVQKELDPNKVHKEAATYVEFYARGDLKTYSTTERPMVLLPVRCISGFLGTCVTMESFSNAYGGQTGNNYQICSSINGVPTNIPFAGETVDCSTDIGEQFYNRYPSLGTKPYTDPTCRGYRGISSSDGCPNAPDLTKAGRPRKAAADTTVQSAIRSGGYFKFGRRRSGRPIVDTSCNYIGWAGNSCHADYNDGDCTHDDDDDDNPQKYHAPSADRLQLYQAGDPCFMFKTFVGTYATGGGTNCPFLAYDAIYGATGSFTHVGSHYRNCNYNDGTKSYHWMAFYPPDEGTRCGVNSNRGKNGVVYTGHGAYLCSGFTDSCAALATSCGTYGRRRRGTFDKTPDPDCDDDSQPSQFTKDAVTFMGASADKNGNPPGQIKPPTKFDVKDGSEIPVNANGAQRPGAYSNEFQDALSEAAAKGPDNGPFTMNGRRRDSTPFGRRRGNNGASRFPGGCLGGRPHLGVQDTAESTTSTFWAANHDTSNVPSKINWMLGSTENTIPGLLRVPVNDDTDTGRHLGALGSVPCPTTPEEAKQSPLNDYFPYHVILDICGKMDCWDQDKRSDGATDTAQYHYGECSLCQPGKWTPPAAVGPGCGSQCFDCPAGQFSNTTSAPECSICPRGKFSTGASESCPDCPAGKFNTIDAASECPSCIPGQYREASSLPAVACSQCDAGMYADNSGLSECKECEKGRFQGDAGAVVCESCPGGKFTDTTGNSSCHICTFGSSSVGSTHPCTECPTGKFSWYDAGPSSTVVVGTCLTLFDTKISSNAPTTGADGSCAFATSCFCCPGGQYGVKRETSLTEEQIRCAETSELRAEFQTCNVCPQGKHAKVPGQLSCSACPRGQYADDAGRLLCTHCPDDHITVDLGSTDAKECVPCATGQFPSPDFSRCQKCATGQYLDLPTMTCTNCPPGKYSDATVLKDRAPCQVCLPGRYSDTESAEECKNCPNGKFQSAPASTSCDGPGCPMNYGSTVVGALAEIDTTCSPSPQNQYYDKTSGIPLKCPSGRFWHPEVGVPETAVLPPTSVVNDHDSAVLACKYAGFDGLCPADVAEECHWANRSMPESCTPYHAICCARLEECLPCTQGKYSDLCATKCETNGQVMSQTNTQACEPCAAGWFWSDDSLACVPCPIKHKRNSSELFVLTNFCSPCEASQHALANRTACVGCDGKDGGYYMSTGGSCSACPKGKFSTSLVDDCTTCPDGQSTEIEGSNQCSIVSNGQYTIEGISTACPSGKYSAIEYLPVETTFDCSQNCVCEDINSNCPIPADVNTGGKSLEAATEECNGSNTCYGLVQLPTTGNSTYFLLTSFALDIKPGLQNDGGILPFTLLLQVPPDGVFLNSTTVTKHPNDKKPYVGCSPCVAGQGNNSDSSACVNCVPGTYADVPGEGCKKCPEGTFTQEGGSRECVPCSAGYGTSDGVSCAACEAGRYKSSTMTSCSLCPGLTVNNRTAQQSCKQKCDSLPPADDHASCTGTNCTEGKLWDENGICSQCPEGRFSTDINTDACTECLRGKTSNANNTACVSCDEGTGANENRTCTKCKPGQFGSTVEGASFCMRCPPGQIQSEQGKSSCVACSPGQFQAAGGRTACLPCPVATYQDKAGMSECTRCPSGTRTVGNQSISADNCSVSCSSCVVDLQYTESLDATKAAADAAPTNCTPTYRIDGATAGTVLSGVDISQLEQVDECGSPLVIAGRRLAEGLGSLALTMQSEVSEAFVAYKQAPQGTKVTLDANISFPSACVYSTWGTYNDCSATCYPSGSTFRPTQYRERTLLLSHGVAACSGMLIESKQCKSSACPVQCVQYWGNWGSCSATCGINSVQSRLRIIKQVPTNGAPPCEKPFSEIRPCITSVDTKCPVDCVYTETVANECTEPCGGGQLHVHYTITQHPRFGGRACPSNVDGRPCNTHPCPADMSTPVQPVQYASSIVIAVFVLTFWFNMRRGRRKKIRRK